MNRSSSIASSAPKDSEIETDRKHAKDRIQPESIWPALGRRLARWSTWTVITVLLFSFVGRYFFLAELICSFRFQLILVLIVLFPVVCWTRHRWLVIASLLAITAGGWAIWSTCLVTPGASLTLRFYSTHQLLTFNVLGSNQNADEVVELVHDMNPEIVVISEYSHRWKQELEPLENKYPHHILQPRWHGFGIGLFSKYEIVDSRVFELTNDQVDAPVIVATLALESNSGSLQNELRSIRVIAVHLLSPTSSERMAIRNQQIREIAELVQRLDEKEPMPTLLVGDFNCVPWSSFLIDLRRETGLRDSRQQFGYQGSWPSSFWPALIPIDQVFVSDRIYVWDRKVLGTSAGSDHYPVLIEFDVEFADGSDVLTRSK